MLVVVFDDEPKAYEGLNALRELHANGDITLYASAVVNKDKAGQLRIEQEAEEGPIGTATGLFTGSLLGLLGGPIGLALGAGVGTITGLAFDIDRDDVSIAFIDEVSSAMAKGKTAILAEIDESWTVPLNTRMDPLGGIVFRRLSYEVAEDQLKREAKDIVTEYHDMVEQQKQGIYASKTETNQAMTNLKKKAGITNKQIGRKLYDVKMQSDAKVNKIEEQMEDAGEKRRARLQKRMNAIKEEYQARMESLQEASGSISDTIVLKASDAKTLVANA
jgi:uncharacterized membrane protein